MVKSNSSRYWTQIYAIYGMDRQRGSVGEYVTCREGDVRSLSFGDNYFDVVVSVVFVHTVEKEYDHRTVEASAERMRVLKPEGVGVLWDLLLLPEYARQLQELKMEDIRVFERVTAFMVSSHSIIPEAKSAYCGSR